MLAFAQLCEAVSATTKKTEKVSLVAEYFAARPVDESAQAAVFLSGRAFPLHEKTLIAVGGTTLWKAVAEVAHASVAAMNTAYRRYGDLGSAAHDIMQSRITAISHGVTLAEVEQYFRRLASVSGPSLKLQVLREMLARLGPLEVKYIVKILTGDMRIGLRESLVEETIAKSYNAEAAEVRRANMLLGDIAQTLRLASEGRLQEARMRLFHPIGVMLASPVETAEEAHACFDHAAVEDKFDGIRAQVHCDGREVRIFSRSMDDITGSFPDIVEAFKSFLREPEEIILDGEILAWDAAAGRAHPFSVLQSRIGRKLASPELVRSVPLAYVAFDALYLEEELILDLPLKERMAKLNALFARAAKFAERPTTFLLDPPQKAKPPGRIKVVPAMQPGLFTTLQQHPDALPLPAIVQAQVRRADDVAAIDRLFDEAQGRGNEGLMLKDLDSAYAPGRRGKSWLKLKRELATLDVVVTSVEYGHGKRANVLSDVTFAVRDGEQLLNVGKAYSGLTDVEIAELTAWFHANTLADHGAWRTVKPETVLEVAFNNVMESERHESGYALRFPRILRLRPDKTAADVDTLDRVREIFEGQHTAESKQLRVKKRA